MTIEQEAAAKCLWYARDGTDDKIPDIVVEYLDDLVPNHPTVRSGDVLNWESAVRLFLWDLAGKP